MAQAVVVKLVDTIDLGSIAARHGGSSPPDRTLSLNNTFMQKRDGDVLIYHLAFFLPFIPFFLLSLLLFAEGLSSRSLLAVEESLFLFISLPPPRGVFCPILWGRD